MAAHLVVTRRITIRQALRGFHRDHAPDHPKPWDENVSR
jgi:hypothetical protein